MPFKYMFGLRLSEEEAEKEDQFAAPDMSGMTDDFDIDHIDSVGEVGRINDDVDISSEDLKTMRELAEMRSIQNFVTLQPSFNVQTGDINENADFDVLIARLEQEFEEEITRSAEGVYG